MHTNMSTMQNTCALGTKVGPFLPMVRTIVLVVPITPSPMMISPKSPSRSPMCVALKLSCLHITEIASVPIHSTTIATYNPIRTPVMFFRTSLKAANKPPRIPVTSRNRAVLSARGVVSRTPRCLCEAHMRVVMRYWSVRQARLNISAKQSTR